MHASEHYGDLHGRHGHCGCHGRQHGFHSGHAEFEGGRPPGPGWALLTHEERVERLVQVKEALVAQLAEIQKTLDLLQPKGKPLATD